MEKVWQPATLDIVRLQRHNLEVVIRLAVLTPPVIMEIHMDTLMRMVRHIQRHMGEQTPRHIMAQRLTQPNNRQMLIMQPMLIANTLLENNFKMDM